MKLIRSLAVCAIVATAFVGSPAGAANDVIRVGEGPFITGGGFFIAKEKGYFDKLGVTVETKNFIDGALAVPSLISGELDISFMTANAGLFNSISKGAPLVFVLDRGNNKKGRGYTVINVTQELFDGRQVVGRFRQAQGQARRPLGYRQHQPVSYLPAPCRTPGSIHARTYSGLPTCRSPI